MVFKVTNLTVDNSATLRKNSITGPYNQPQGRDKLLTPSVKGEN